MCSKHMSREDFYFHAAGYLNRLKWKCDDIFSYKSPKQLFISEKISY